MGRKRSCAPIFEGNAVLTAESFFLVFPRDLPAYLSSLAQSTTSPMKEEASPSSFFPFSLGEGGGGGDLLVLFLWWRGCHVRRRGTFHRSFLRGQWRGENKVFVFSISSSHVGEKRNKNRLRNPIPKERVNASFFDPL